MTMKVSQQDATVKKLARYMALNCVRNTVIENYHCGEFPQSEKGDYSDVTVVTPSGEIPWNEVSRISDPEMMHFNKEVVDLIYTFLHFMIGNSTKEERDAFFSYIELLYPNEWDEPKLDKTLMSVLERKVGKSSS